MSIINTFDPFGKELIRAQDAIRPIENFPKTVLVVFSAKFCSLFLKKHEATEIGSLSGGGTRHPIYQFDYKGVRMGFFTSTLGGPRFLKSSLPWGRRISCTSAPAARWTGKLPRAICWCPQPPTETRA